MTDRRPLGLPLFRSPATEEAEPTEGQCRLPVEQGAQFLAPPAAENDEPPSRGRRSLDSGGLTFSAPDQP